MIKPTLFASTLSKSHNLTTQSQTLPRYFRDKIKQKPSIQRSVIYKELFTSILQNKNRKFFKLSQSPS